MQRHETATFSTLRIGRLMTLAVALAVFTIMSALTAPTASAGPKENRETMEESCEDSGGIYYEGAGSDEEEFGCLLDDSTISCWDSFVDLVGFEYGCVVANQVVSTPDPTNEPVRPRGPGRIEQRIDDEQRIERAAPANTDEPAKPVYETSQTISPVYGIVTIPSAESCDQALSQEMDKASSKCGPSSSQPTK